MEAIIAFRIIQSIMQECDFPSEQTAREDHLYYRLNELSQCGIIGQDEVDEIHALFVTIYGRE